MARKSVTANDSKSLRFMDCILAIGFCITKDLQPGTISRTWVAKYLKKTKKLFN